MRDRLTTDKTKIFARENPLLMSITKDELRKLYNEVFDRLQEYEVAEEQGQIIIPPCKVGDVVYSIANGVIEECVITEWFYTTGMEPYYAFYAEVNTDSRLFLFLITSIGKTVFLTREEAEQALKGGASDA